MQKEMTLKEFYASDPQRAAAPEVPYGSLWREFAFRSPGASVPGLRNGAGAASDQIVTPIFTAQKKPVKQGLKPEDIATNEFIDPEIRLP